MREGCQDMPDCNSLECELAGIEETAALYSFGSLSDAETMAFNARLSSGCRLCYSALVHANEGAVALSLSVPEAVPQTELRSRLLNNLGSQLPANQATVSRFFDSNDWPESGVWGIQEKILFQDPVSGLQTSLVRMQPGARFPAHFHSKTEQCLVLDGEVYWGRQRYAKGDFVIGLAGQRLPEISSNEGNILLMIGSADAQFTT